MGCTQGKKDDVENPEYTVHVVHNDHKFNVVANLHMKINAL
jgi:hypothetical protein